MTVVFYLQETITTEYCSGTFWKGDRRLFSEQMQVKWVKMNADFCFILIFYSFMAAWAYLCLT